MQPQKCDRNLWFFSLVSVYRYLVTLLLRARKLSSAWTFEILIMFFFFLLLNTFTLDFFFFFSRHLLFSFNNCYTFTKLLEIQEEWGRWSKETSWKVSLLSRKSTVKKKKNTSLPIWLMRNKASHYNWRWLPVFI